MNTDFIIAGIVFFSIYHMLKLISDHLLKRKLIKAGQYERVGILETPKVVTEEANRYPSLKWGLVALTTGLGFITIEILRASNPYLISYEEAGLPIGILLISVSLGFLIYFFIMNRKKY